MASPSCSAESLCGCLFITANVGSLFEPTQKFMERWIEKLVERIAEHRPNFVAVHFQEVGGKQYTQCMSQVKVFTEQIYESCEKLGFASAIGFYDDDFTAKEEFTALGAMFLVGEAVRSRVLLWDFQAERQAPLNPGLQIFCGASDVGAVKKTRFPSQLWPTAKWGRKGYLLTSWQIGKLRLNLLNLHLFHDESNVVAVEKSPSEYSSLRASALKFALDSCRPELKNGDAAPLILFGDFNFRLDQKHFVDGLVKESPSETTSCYRSPAAGDSNRAPNSSRGKPTAILYHRRESNNCVLRIEKKRFEHESHDSLRDSWTSYLQYDRELDNHPQLHEFAINFPPTYPWSEEPEAPQSYMRTRAPAWCDRILLNDKARAAVVLADTPTPLLYNVLGIDTCMGDHKPVSLFAWFLAEFTESGDNKNRDLYHSACQL